MSEKQCILLLWYLTNASPSAYWKLYKTYKSASNALSQNTERWKNLTIHQSHLKRFQDYKEQGKPQVYLECLEAVKRHDFSVLFHEDLDYPQQLNILHDPPPILFFKGNKDILNQPQIAIVGSRKPSQSAQKIAQNFAEKIASEGLWITSGLAVGIDSNAHIGALKQQKGRTIVVLGNGIDICYPQQNMWLYQQVLAEGGAIISELLPHMQPIAHNFPRRNRIVSGLSLATIVVEAALKSGSLITANLSAEQGKLVFAIPGHIDNPLAKGCHHLIREGAILVDSPEQVIEDINLPRRLHLDAVNSEPKENIDNSDIQKHAQGNIPSSQKDHINHHNVDTHSNAYADDCIEHLEVYLKKMLVHLDWIGMDMDSIINHTGLDISTVSSQLMELELQGLVIQTAGLYMRCRQ